MQPPKYRTIKLLIALAILISLCFVVPLARGQATNPLDSIPTTSLSLEKFGLSLGSAMQGKGESFNTEADARWCFHQNFALSGSIQTGQGGGGLIDTAGLSIQVRRPWDNYEVYGTAGARRNWRDNKWEAIAGIGAKWKPIDSGVLSKVTFALEQRIVGSDVKARPILETFTGISYSF